ncbi:hypothetical protein HPB47_025963 [Ixodes persulcatus]|uniref:Uncharacterized protein n=1 Tax=Ixodes persulcatus TaxID=34615 RepID=A0AC60PZZ4_IXOPE|nr:hypothetical protein HPB47_025963 [Ixodes persulcatus]
MPQREVARMTGRTRTAVARIFTAFRDDNGRIHDAPHDVRPRSTTDEEDRWIVAAAVDQPFITAERGVAVMPWPPKGADMNPIENIWGNMKIQLSRRGLHSVTTDQLWDAVKEEWDRLRQCPELVVNLYESLPLSTLRESRDQPCLQMGQVSLSFKDTKKRQSSALIPQLLVLFCVAFVRSPRLVAVYLQCVCVYDGVSAMAATLTVVSRVSRETTVFGVWRTFNRRTNSVLHKRELLLLPPSPRTYFIEVVVE